MANVESSFDSYVERIITERTWYLIIQDGRLDYREYPTKQLAQEAYDRLPDKKGICLSSHMKEVKREYTPLR